MSRPPFLVFLCALSITIWSSSASARTGAAPHSVPFGMVALDDDADKAPAAPVKNAGSIDGLVVAVDYKLGHITVKAASSQYDITVSPSTEFRGHNNKFHTIADIQKGAHVRVLMSQRAGTYTAQIIRFL